MSQAHDDVVRAFREIDPTCTSHSAGGDKPADRYTHIHSSERSEYSMPCEDHQVAVIEESGLVSLRRHLARPFALKPRTDRGIGDGKYGEFDYAETPEEIVNRWGSLEAFARDVISVCRGRGLWRDYDPQVDALARRISQFCEGELRVNRVSGMLFEVNAPLWLLERPHDLENCRITMEREFASELGQPMTAFIQSGNVGNSRRLAIAVTGRE